VVVRDALAHLGGAFDGVFEARCGRASRALAGARFAEALQVPLERLWDPNFAHFSLRLVQLSRCNSTPA